MLPCCYKLYLYINRFICWLASYEAASDNLDYSLLTNTITEDN
jgi:hypothetical protein